MRHHLLNSTIAVATLAAALTPSALAVSFQPTPADLNDLDHNKAYKWKIAYSIPAGQEIVSATLSIKNINNWNTADNHLYIDLFNANSTSGGVSTFSDGESWGDYFDTYGPSSSDGNLGPNGVRIATYVDTSSSPETQSWSIPVGTLTSFLTDGTSLTKLAQFALTFDPDCHYYNDGITLTIETEKVSTPDAGSTAALMIPALGALAYFRRRS